MISSEVALNRRRAAIGENGMIKSRALLLAGVSALAMLICAAEANADDFTAPGKFSFTVLTSGEYSLEVLGASGGDGHMAGGLGAEVSGDIFLTAGEDLTLFVGGRGQSSSVGGGGGGSFVFLGTSVLAVAAGGGGGGFSVDGGFGRSGTTGGAGGGTDGGPGGLNGSGGVGGTFENGGNGGGGAGASFGAAGYGGVGAGPLSGSGAKFPEGGAGATLGANGGFGGGGGGGLQGGGGGGGYSGGGGGGYGGGGGGGGSFVATSFDQFAIYGGVNSGNGSITITPVSGSAVPEPSTWAMALGGFAGLGWLAHMRRRKTSPA
jgi:hypothetical protein